MKHGKKYLYIFRKSFINLLIILVGALCAAFILIGMQRKTIRDRVQSESEQILTQIAETLEKNRSDVEELTIVYHDLNQSTVLDLKDVMAGGLFHSIAEADTAGRAEIMADITTRSDVPYLFIMDADGVVFAAPHKDLIGRSLIEDKLLTKENLQKLLQSGSDLCYVREENDTGRYYFYSEVIESDHGTYYLIFGTDAAVLEEQFNSLTDVTRVIENVIVGETGFVFAIDRSDNSFIYYNDNKDELTGKNALECGLAEAVLTDAYVGTQQINGTNYFCVSKECGDVTLAVAASDLNDMYDTGTNSWKWSIFGFLAVSLLCLIYASIVRNDHLFNERESKKISIYSSGGQEYFFNVSIFRRILPVMILGIILIFGVSFYSTTLLEINRAITDSNVNINELENNFADADVSKEIVTEYYEKQYLAKARILAYLFEENPEVLNTGRDKQYFAYDDNNERHSVKDDEGNPLTAVSESTILADYCWENDLASIHIYDEEGRVIATNLSDWHFQLSFNEEDQSYPFRQVLDQITDHYIQEKMTNEAGSDAQYIGTSFTYYTTKDKNGRTRYASREEYLKYQAKVEGASDGVLTDDSGEDLETGSPITKHSSLLQIGMDVEIIDEILATSDYQSLLRKTLINDSYLVLFDNTEEHKVLYSPKEESIGKTAAEIGLGTNAFSGNYIGFQKANGINYLIDIQYNNGYYIGTAILKENLYSTRFNVALVTALFGLLFIFVMSLLATLSSEKEEQYYIENSDLQNLVSDRIMFMISTPDGDMSVTEKAVSRWDNKNIPWRERTPEQKLAFFFFLVAAIAIFNILIFAMLVSRGKAQDSILSFILSGNWDKGYNIFAMSACGLVMAGAIVAAQFLNIPIRLVTSIFGTKSETVGHLMASVIKYAAAIYGIFYCLYLLGFDSTSLMTSAGILSLVIGLGSQSLIKDVVAGIFIIFEGEFRVGDIVTIGGYRGQVLDVGLRTTKIMSADHNIKILNNNEVNGVINMTRVSSICSIDVPIAITVPIEELEKILERDLPPIKEAVPGIIDGPYYKGVLSFDRSSFTVQISVLCKERNIVDVKSGLNKEVLDLLHRNGLNEA